MSFRRRVDSHSYLGVQNVYSGQEYMIKIKVSLTIVTVFLVCHLPRIFSDVQEIICNFQLSLDEVNRAKVSFCGNTKPNNYKELYFLQCLTEYWSVTHVTRFFLLYINSAVNFLIYFTFYGGFEYLRRIFNKNNMISSEETHEMMTISTQP